MMTLSLQITVFRLCAYSRVQNHNILFLVFLHAALE